MTSRAILQHVYIICGADALRYALAHANQCVLLYTLAVTTFMTSSALSTIVHILKYILQYITSRYMLYLLFSIYDFLYCIVQYMRSVRQTGSYNVYVCCINMYTAYSIKGAGLIGVRHEPIGTDGRRSIPRVLSVSTVSVASRRGTHWPVLDHHSTAQELRYSNNAPLMRTDQ